MSKDLFKQALEFVLEWEGDYVNDPDDKGGATNKGITQSTYNNYRKNKNIAIQSVKSIIQTEIEDIYYNSYWLKAGCEKMSPVFAVLAFDTAVNMGVSRVNEFLQSAEYLYPDKYVLARIQKYIEFARVGNQQKFLLGWLNRVFDLKTFVEKI